MSDDDFFLDDDPEAADTVEGDFGSPWTILIVDDEPDIHEVTKLALKGFSYLGRSVEYLSAYSAREAVDLVDAHDDLALILLDVVMENDHAGLEFARWLRDERGNLETRIVLRTGQPGQAPERQAVLAYDINDYKAKSELTADRLFGAVVTALRGYDELRENARFREEIFQQMADRSRAERELVEMLPFPILQTDSVGQIIGANASLAALSGQTDADAMIGQLADSVLPPDVARLLDLEQDDASGNQFELAGKKYHVLRRAVMDAVAGPVGVVLCLITV